MINEAILDAAKRVQVLDAAKKLPAHKQLQPQKWAQPAKSGKGA
jgi:hypothetical protein